MKVQDKIRQMQNERNWSVNHMALEAGLSDGTINGWYKKNSTPTIEGLQKICGAFGISMSQLFNEDSQPTYLTDFQADFLKEFDLLHNNEKQDILQLIKTINQNRKNSNPQ